MLIGQQQHQINDGWHDEYGAMAKRYDEAQRHQRENADVERVDRPDVITEQLEGKVVVIDHPCFIKAQAERLAAICDGEIGSGSQRRVGFGRMGIEKADPVVGGSRL